LNLFVLHGATGEPIRAIVRGSMPFVILQLLVVVALFMFPQIALFLPSTTF
jgi:TRAP-type C4-dicarboxylate transport system permease large subunit